MTEIEKLMATLTAMVRDIARPVVELFEAEVERSAAPLRDVMLAAIGVAPGGVR